MLSPRRRKASTLPLICSCCFFAATFTLSTAVAEDSASKRLIEEIVVRGEFRSPALRNVAASVTVLDPNAARQTQINHLEELLGWAANVNYSNGASRGRFIQVRGIGERGQFVEPLNPSVGLTLDGVDLTGVGTAGTLYDIAQVEVFRGPQGTLYGANALAGLINLVSERPAQEFGGRIDLDAGDFGARGIGAVLTGPISETAQFRLAARQYEDDGFIENTFLDRDDTNNRDELTVRGRLSWQVSDRHELDFAFGHIDVNSGYDAFSLDNDRRTRSDQPGDDQQQTQYVSAKWQWQANEAFDVQVNLGHVQAESDYSFDEDWTFIGFDVNGYTSFDRYERDREATSLEIRATSSPAGGLFDGRTAWTLGTYALTQDASLDRTYSFDSPFDSDFEFDRVAVYGELQHQINDVLSITGGLRVERHNASYSNNRDVDLDPSDTLVGGRLLLQWQLNDQISAYGVITRGYKTGLFNTDGSLDEDLRSYDAETAWAYEVGLKTQTWQDRLQLNAALFWLNRDDVQVATSIVRVRDDNSAEFIDFVSNAASGTNYGAELDAQLYLNDQWAIFASVGFLQTEINDFINAAGVDLDGRDQSQAPGYQFLIATEYSPTANWFVRVEVEGKDDYFLSDSHSERAPGYELVNATIGYNTERWQVKLWARNLTDKDVVTRGFFFGNDPRDGFTARGFNQLGEPRNYGLSLGMSF